MRTLGDRRGDGAAASSSSARKIGAPLHRHGAERQSRWSAAVPTALAPVPFLDRRTRAPTSRGRMRVPCPQWDGSVTIANSSRSEPGLRLDRSSWPSWSGRTEPGARWLRLATGAMATPSTLTVAMNLTRLGAHVLGTRPGNSEPRCRVWERLPRARLSSSFSPRRWSLEYLAVAHAPAGAQR